MDHGILGNYNFHPRFIGYASYTGKTKTKEGAIKKTRVAAAIGITMQLSMGFIKPVGIAIMVGLPAPWFINNLRLETLAYRIHLSAETISIALRFILFLTVLTVGSEDPRHTY